MGTSELRYGFLAGAVSVILALISLYMKWAGTAIGDLFDYSGVIVIGVGAYYAVRDRKAEQAAPFTFGHAFFTGAITCFVAAILMGSFYYVYAVYIDPGQVEAKVKEGIDIMTAKKFTAEEVQRRVPTIRAMYSPNGQFMSGSGTTMLYGLVVSTVIAVFMTRSKRETTK